MPSQPQLPRQLVREILTKPWMEGFKSSVFDANGHRLRCCIVDKKNPMNADWFIESHHGGLFSLLDTKKTGLTSATSARYTDYTVLHEAIDTTDPLLAAEIIRLGALVDKINGRGQTPLLHALERLGDIDALYEQSRKSSSLMARLMRFDHWRARLKFIAILLIDQHADVNATVQWGGRTVTPLFFAAGIARDFDLVAILLAHEYWNDKEHWLQPSQTSTLPLTISQTDPRIQAACDEDKNVDPAFAWAYSQLKFLPMPDARTRDKKSGVSRAKKWNSAVDRYIASSSDLRPRLDIECAAKIGHSLGPRHKVCEAPGCGKVEGKDLKEVLACSGCKMTYYCGWKCQKTSWEEHRKICKTPEQQEVPLPSQRAIEAFVLTRGFFMFEERLGIKDEEELWEKLSKMGLCKNI
ncbi:hypothetical protein C8J55DRAFT_552664 [Lentinula edodes]|uniref:MYND-type domain-containing protein n=1 Tax=Lentinula lateritia TaxID=40482 RepID=A0A9W9DER3_9AGAR|nr:hypothetical protein C8J55DRAFT_552664 [Lentinula edodes]